MTFRFQNPRRRREDPGHARAEADEHPGLPSSNGAPARRRRCPDTIDFFDGVTDAELKRGVARRAAPDA